MRAFIISSALLVCAAGLHAAQYSRRVWRTEEGLPQNKIQSFAQTPDGYLWIGTSGGLVRFDGARFTVFDRSNTPALHDDSVLSLLAARDGSLWIGTEGGGFTHYRNREFTSYGLSEGLTNGFVRAMLEDSHGRLWLGTDRGFYRLENSRLIRIDGRSGTPIVAAYSVFEDSTHTLWVGTSYGLFRMEGDRMVSTVEHPQPTSVISSIFEPVPGELWLASLDGLRRVANGHPLTGPDLSDIKARRIARDAAGNIWVGASTAGLFEFVHGNAAERRPFGALPDNSVLAIFSDSQHNLWVGTQDGLLRLTETTVQTVNSADGLAEDDVQTAYSDPRGTLWLGTVSSLLYRMENSHPVLFHPPSPDPAFPARSIYVSPDGVQWIGSSTRGFLRIGPEGARLFNVSTGLRNNAIRAFLRTHDGLMWIATGSGLSRWDGVSIRNYYLEDGLAYGGVRTLAEDSNGDLIVGTDGGVNRVRNSRFIQDATFARLGNERVWSILPDANGVLWLGTRGSGVVRIEGARITRLTTREGLPSNSIYQILRDGEGRLWMSSAAGVFSAAQKQMDAIARGAPGPVYVVPYDTDDGMLSSQMNGGSQCAGTRDAEGNFWFPSVKGAVRLDTRHLRTMPASPVLIEGLLADQQPVAGTSGLSIAPGSSRIEVDFTAPDLAAPDRVSFRYMLEGFDKTWVPSLKRRAALYTNLPPRHYRFRVIAHDVAQPGHSSEASIAFDLRPHFYESKWFYAAVLAALGLLVLGAFRLYARQTQARYALVLAERTRLAREMHDTVIQGCVGVSSLLEAVRSMPASAEAKSKELIDRAASQVRLTVNEAREAVWDMRHSSIEHSLPETLEDFLRQVPVPENISVRTEVEGTPASVSESSARTLLLVAREAVRNAVQHGAPERIGVKLHFERAEVGLEVRDNGRGFHPGHTNAAGHYGVVGMRERVEQSGGTFELRSSPGGGTIVLARLPLKKHGARKHARP